MVIDILFVITLAYGFYVGFSKGIIRTVFTLLGYIVALVASFKFAPLMTNLLESSFDSSNPLLFVAGFVVTFLLAMLLIRVLVKGLEGFLQTIHINVINQVIGGVFMAAVMVLVYAVLLWFANQSTILTDTAKKESFTYEYLEDYPEMLWAGGKRLRPVFEDFWDSTVEFMDRVQNRALERTESDPAIYDIEEQFNDIDDSSSGQDRNGG